MRLALRGGMEPGASQKDSSLLSDRLENGNFGVVEPAALPPPHEIERTGDLILEDERDDKPRLQLLGHTLLNLVLSSVGPTVVEPRRPARGAGVADRRARPPGSRRRRCWRCPEWPLVVAGVALVVRASRPAMLVEPAT